MERFVAARVLPLALPAVAAAVPWAAEAASPALPLAVAVSLVLRAAATVLMLAWAAVGSRAVLTHPRRERVGSLKGRIRRITIVAVARKLLIALWRYLEAGVVPAGAVLKV